MYRHSRNVSKRFQKDISSRTKYIEQFSQQAQLSWDRLKEAQFSSVLAQISFAQENQLREAQFSNLILIQISLAQKSQLRKAKLFSSIFTQS